MSLENNQSSEKAELPKLSELEVFDKLPLALWVALGKDDNYRICLWNKGAEQTYGIPKSEAIGKSYIDLFVEDGIVAEQSKKDCDRVIAGDFIHPPNCLAIDENKTESKKVILLTNVFRYEHDGIPYQAEVSVNLTESGFFEFVDEEYMAKRDGPNHEVERTLKAFIDHAKNKIERNLKLWARTFAHEIRSELVVLKNAQEDLAEQVEGIRDLDSFQQIERAYRTLHLQSQNFLSANQMGMSNIASINESDKSFNFNSILYKVIKEYEVSARIKGIKISVFNLTAFEELNLKGSRDAFVNVARNVLSNAIKHSGKNVYPDSIPTDKLEISISCQTEQDVLVIAITNLGQMTDDELENKFKAFYKKDRHPDEGLHLGLSIAKQWMDVVGGNISVENNGSEHVTTKICWPML